MNKRLLFIGGCLLAACVAFGMTDTERQYLRNLALRPRCVQRQAVVIGGVTNVVEVWQRGEYTWAQTNVARCIVGTVQQNTFQDKLDELKRAEAAWRAQAEEWIGKYNTATNKATVFRDYLVTKTESGTVVQKALAKLILEKYDEIINRVEAGK